MPDRSDPPDPEPADGPDMLTIREVAKRLGLSTETVRRHARRGTLPFEKIGGTWLMSRERLNRLMGTVLVLVGFAASGIL